MSSSSPPLIRIADIAFIDNPVALGRKEHYMSVEVDTAKIVKSWRLSLFSYEWLLPDGRIKSAAELPDRERERRLEVEDRLARGLPLERPILGVGLLENVEIGSGRATFLTLAALGAHTVPVHIPKPDRDEFAAFLI